MDIFIKDFLSDCRYSKAKPAYLQNFFPERFGHPKGCTDMECG